ncbi:unnamed protein product [Brassicogethes aeneus]|uniref:Uncharacterized protein n=1 Tax=Brassicogethes aeneus TaxID=1431903 RepID=A0A9P0BAP7_BRAAE|nr:unnamed protein product [Brassicogethes aeneus]
MELFEEWQKHAAEQRRSRRSLKKIISIITSKLAKKWTAAYYKMDRFLNKNRAWLDVDIKFKITMEHPLPSTSGNCQPGRPKKIYEESPYKTKKRRIKDLLQSRSASELTTAAEVANRLAGNRKIATLIKKSTQISKEQESKNVICGGRQLSSDEALAYYVDSKCTSHSYKQTRKWSLKAGHKVFPSYQSLSNSKKLCYPSDDNISVTETRAQIKLQAILDKTAERLIQAQTNGGVMGALVTVPLNRNLRTPNAEADEFLFVFAFVPLRLSDGQNIIWQNPRPSSTLYCRPIKFIFSKETNEFTETESNKVLKEVSELLPTHRENIGESQISVKHNLLQTMVDGKVSNALTNTKSPQKCYICGATPKIMNGKLKNVAKKEHYGFGLSTLHAWIRCFECFLHIGYRLNIKKWQAIDDSDKISLQQRSAEIKKKFKNQMGLIVDKPKPGYGNTNDGNTVRRFFMNPKLSGEITGLDVNLIKKFCIILRTLSSGTEVIKSCILPIGQLSEESQKSRNKDCRRFRQHHTRKQSRVSTSIDLLHMLLITSDPVINSLREIPKRKSEKFSVEVLDLLVSPSIPKQQQQRSDDEEYLIEDSSDSNDE